MKELSNVLLHGGISYTDIIGIYLPYVKGIIANINDEKISKIINETKNSIHLQKQNKEAYAHGITMSDKFYPEETNPRGFNSERLSKYLDKIKANDLQGLWHQILLSQGVTVSMVGDITPQESRTIIKDIFCNVPDKKLPQMEAPKHESHTKEEVFTVINPTQQQVTLSKRWEIPGEATNKDDRYPLLVLKALLNGIHGKLFEASRIDREQGLLYSIGAGMSQNKSDGAFIIKASTEAGNAQHILKLMDEVIQNIIQTPPKKEELARIINRTRVGVILANQGVDKLAHYLTSHRAYGYDSLEEELEQLKNVTPEQVQAVAKKYLTRPAIITASSSKENLLQAGFQVSR